MFSIFWVFFRRRNGSYDRNPTSFPASNSLASTKSAGVLQTAAAPEQSAGKRGIRDMVGRPVVAFDTFQCQFRGVRGGEVRKVGRLVVAFMAVSRG